MDVMDCERARDAWHDQCDGLLPAADRQALTDHLEQCEACRRYHAEMDRIDGALERLRLATESVDSTQSIARPQGRPAWRPAMRAGGLAAMLALVVSAAWYTQRPAQPTRPGPTTALKPTDSSRGPVVESPTVPDAFVPTVSLSQEQEEDYLIVHEDSSASNVHVFRLYRITKLASNASTDGATVQ